MSQEADSGTTTSADAKLKGASTIAFPYGGLDDAEQLAVQVHEQYGTTASPSQVAAALGLSSNSGTFRVRIATARTFGVLDSRRTTGDYSLTDLGRRLTDPTAQARARVDAFMNVPLYKALFDQYEDRPLPAERGLEAEIIRLGVTPKSVARARQAFQRSARHAGLFHAGSNRLVIPALRRQPASAADPASVGNPEPSRQEAPVTTSMQQGFTFSDPLIEGLVRRLPKPGETFTSVQRKKWIGLAENILEAVFGTDDEDRREETR